MEYTDLVQVNLHSVHGYLRCRCAYCYSPRGLNQAGLKIDSVPLDIYTDLINRGWSRFGNYYCKIDPTESCCKVFPLRLDVTKHKMRHSHSKAIKKWKKFVDGQDFKPKDVGKESDDVIDEEQNEMEEMMKNKFEIPEKKLQSLKHDINLQLLKKEGEKQIEDQLLISKALEKLCSELEKQDSHIFFQGLGLQGPYNLEMGEKCKKKIKVLKSRSPKYGDFNTNFLQILFSNNQQKLSKIGIKNLADFVRKIKTPLSEQLAPLIGSIRFNIQDNGYIGFVDNSWEAKEMKLLEREKKNGNWWNILTPAVKSQSSGEYIKDPSKLNKALKVIDGMFVEKRISDKGADRPDLSQQNKVTKDMFGQVIREQSINPKGRKFEIKMEKAKFERESFELYKKYCSDRHKGSNRDEKTYGQFMCIQNLEYEKLESEGHELRLGCYHTKYYLDGKLIAVGVLDIAPTCIYSVYFFYDPDYKHLSLGTVSIIKEIEYMKEMQKYFPDFKYYHLGGYVQNCQKMSYKKDFEPAELLCPMTFQWVMLDEEVEKRIEENKKRLCSEEREVMEDMDFSREDTEKYVKDHVQISVRGATRLQELGEISPKYYVKVFKELVMGLGKKLTDIFEFGIYDSFGF